MSLEKIATHQENTENNSEVLLGNKSHMLMKLERVISETDKEIDLLYEMESSVQSGETIDETTTKSFIDRFNILPQFKNNLDKQKAFKLVELPLEKSNSDKSIFINHINTLQESSKLYRRDYEVLLAKKG